MTAFDMKRRDFLRGGAVAAVAAIIPAAIASRPDYGNMRLYEVGGMTSFPEVNNDGSYVSRVCTFPLIERDDGSILVYGHRIDLQHHLSMREEYAVRIKQDSFAAFTTALDKGVQIIDRVDGGLMPLNGEIVRLRRRT